MPIINVPGVGQVRFPDDMSDKDIISAIQNNILKTPKEEPGVKDYLKDIPKAVGRGAVGLLETAGVGASALLPEDYEQKARAGIESIAAPARQYLAPSSQEVGESVASTLASGVGSTGPFFALGPLGLLGRTAASALGVAAGAGEARQEAEKAGATAEERSKATMLGAPTGLLDLIAPNVGPLKSIFTTALARGGVEGLTEAAQKTAQNMIAKGVYDPSKDVLAGTAEEGAYGAGVGALTSLLIDVALGRRAKGGGPKTEVAPEVPTGMPAEVPPEAPAAPSLETLPPGAATPDEQAEAYRMLSQMEQDRQARGQQVLADQEEMIAQAQRQRLEIAPEVARGMPGFTGMPDENAAMMGAIRQRQEEERAAEEERQVAEQLTAEKERQAEIRRIQQTTFSADPVQNQIVKQRLLDQLADKEAAKLEEVAKPAEVSPAEEPAGLFPKGEPIVKEPQARPRGAKEYKYTPEEKYEITTLKDNLAAVNKEITKAKSEKGNLFKMLEGKLIERPGAFSLNDVAPDDRNLRRLLSKDNKGVLLEDMVSDGLLDDYLPPKNRKMIGRDENPRFDEGAALEHIAEKLRNKDYMSEFSSANIRALEEQRDAYKTDIERLQAVPDVNLALAAKAGRPRVEEVEPLSFDDLVKEAQNNGIDVEALQKDVASRMPEATPEQFQGSFRGALESGIQERRGEQKEDVFSQEGKVSGNNATPEGMAIQKQLENKDFNGLIQWAINNAPDRFQKLVAQKIKTLAGELQRRGVEMTFSMSTGKSRPLKLSAAAGVTSFLWGKDKSSVEVILNGEPVVENQLGYPSGMTYDTIQHELLHSVVRTSTKFLPNSNPVIKELNDLYNKVIDQYNKDAKDGTLPPVLQKFYKRINNVLSTPDELISWGITDKDFQDYLSKINVGPKQSAFNKLVELIREILSLPKAFETALERLVRTTDSLLSLDSQVISDAIEAQGYSLGKPQKQAKEERPAKEEKPVGPMSQQSLFAKSEKLEKGAGPQRTQTGEDAMEILSGMGRFVKEPEPGYVAKARKAWDNAVDNPKLAKEQSIGAFRRWTDQFETWAFSSDAALNNQIRREVMDSMKGQEEKIGILLNASLSQTVHSDAVANLFLMKGNVKYDNELHKWVGVDDKSNIFNLSKQLDEIAQKHGLTKEEIELIAHTAFEAKRTQSLVRENEAIEARVAAMRAEARRIRGNSPVAASELSDKASKLLQKVKVIHMTDEDIAAGMSQFELFPELSQVVETWNGIRENALTTMVDTGLYSREEAENLLSNADYVPFFREDQIEEGKGPKEFLRSLSVQADKRMKGSKKPVNDIFDNMVRWTQYAVNRGVRNRSALALVDTAGELKLGEKVTGPKDGENVVRVWRNGEQEYHSMADPMFVTAFRGLESVAIPTVKFFSKFADTLRQSVVLFPLFSVSQVTQDSFAAMFSSGLKPQHALSIPFRAVKEFIQTLRGKSSTHEELKNVGAVGVRDFTSSIIRSDVEILAGLKKDKSLWDAVKRSLGNVAMAADNAVRQATYEAALAQGMSKAEAIEKAFEIFNVRRRGSSQMLAMAGQVIPFFNAYLAAQNVAYRTLTGVGVSPTDRKAALQTLAATTGSVMALSMLYAMMMGDDEDYEKKPTPTRDRLLMIPGSGGLGIPLRADAFILPKVLAEHTYHLLTENGMTDGAKLRASLASLLANSVLSPTPVPQAVKPIAESILNYDFFQQKPLVGIYQAKKDLSRQFEDSTSEFSKVLGKTELISPIVADHVIRGMFGSFGGLFLQVTNPLIAEMAGVTRPSMSIRDAANAIPNASAFISKEYEVGLRKDFYALKEVTDRAAATLSDMKARSPQEIEAYLSDPEVKQRVAMAPVVNRISNQLTDIRKKVNLITNVETKEMTDDRKEELIKQLREQEYQLLKNINLRKLREMAQM